MSAVFPPLQESTLRARLSSPAAGQLQHLTLLDEVGSTNAWLLQKPAAELHAHAVLAEQQTAGRGRRGKAWQSPPGSNIYLSLGWIFDGSAPELPCLPLAAGVAVVRALESLGFAGAGLKWPNDIQVEGRKLGGILLESRPASAGRSAVVMGIGLNVAMPSEHASAQAIDQPWIALAELEVPPRNPALRDQLAGALLEQLLRGLPEFASFGFEPFQQDWQRLDVLLGQAVTVASAGGEVQGRALGIDEQGNLRVEEEFGQGQQRLHSFSSGEVSVRRTKPAGLEPSG